MAVAEMRISHKGHKHPATASARAICRQQLMLTGKDPLKDLYTHDLVICEALGISPEDWDRIGDQAKRIIGEILPQFVQGFVQANLHYGDKNANVLGPAGQFADIWRKIGPLRRALWEGADLTREGPADICMDLIGHCLMTIDMLRQGVDRRGTGPGA